MSAHRWVLRSLIVAVCVVVAGAGAAGARDPWTEPRVIHTQRESIDDIRMGVDRDGHVSIVGRDEAGLFSLRNHGAGWKFVRIWSDPLMEESYDPIAGVFDRDGHSWVAWSRPCVEGDCSNAGIWMLTDRYGGPNHGWPAEPVRLVAGRKTHAAIQVAGARIHLVYADLHDRLHYRTATSTSGPWTDLLVWGDEIAFLPSIVLDANGRPNVLAWRVPYLVWARDVGTPGSPDFRSRTVPGTGDEDPRGWLALDAAGRARVAWTHDSYCGVGPCPPEPSRGTWLRTWKGSEWSSKRHLSLAWSLGIRVGSDGRTSVLTDRPSAVQGSGASWRTTVLLPDPNAMPNRVQAGAIALTVGGTARAVVVDRVKTADGWRWGVLLTRER